MAARQSGGGCGTGVAVWRGQLCMARATPPGLRAAGRHSTVAQAARALGPVRYTRWALCAPGCRAPVSCKAAASALSRGMASSPRVRGTSSSRAPFKRETSATGALGLQGRLQHPSTCSPGRHSSVRGLATHTSRMPTLAFRIRHSSVRGRATHASCMRAPALLLQLAFRFRHSALGAVAQEQQPALLLLDELGVGVLQGQVVKRACGVRGSCAGPRATWLVRAGAARGG